MKIDWKKLKELFNGEIRVRKAKPTALQLYLKDWLAWAEAGGNVNGDAVRSPEGAYYSQHSGLCFSAEMFRDATGIYVGRDLRQALENTFGSWAYPFGSLEYDLCTLKGTHHLDPKRLEWVRVELGLQDPSGSRISRWWKRLIGKSRP